MDKEDHTVDEIMYLYKGDEELNKETVLWY